MKCVKRNSGWAHATPGLPQLIDSVVFTDLAISPIAAYGIERASARGRRRRPVAIRYMRSQRAVKILATGNWTAFVIVRAESSILALSSWSYFQWLPALLRQ